MYRSVLGCGRVYEVSGEVCWHVGKGMGEV